MAIIIKWKGELPKRLENYVIYKLDDVYVIREFSGITKALLKEPRYAKCLQNANEFGRISTLSKLFRHGLNKLLPRKKNMEVVNSLAQVLYKAMQTDLTSAPGERNLASAFQNKLALDMMSKHDFNPDARLEQVFKAPYYYEHDTGKLYISPFIAKDSIHFPDGNACALLQFHRYYFNFYDASSTLASSDPVLVRCDSILKAETVLITDIPVPVIEDCIQFLLFSVQFYNNAEGCLIPLSNDSFNAVRIFGASRQVGNYLFP